MSLAGQWIGAISGAFQGLGVLELDEIGNGYSGTGFMFSNDPNIPSTEVQIRTDNRNELRFRAPTFVLDGAGNRYDPKDISKRFPDWQHGREVDISIEVRDGEIHIKFATDINTIGQGVLLYQGVDRETGIAPEKDVSSWQDFRTILGTIDTKKFIFRGQPGPFPLRTSFHRTSRTDLARYMDVDTPALQRHLSSIIPHQFDFRDPGQVGNFFNLVQHHGYPTPLLDWTESPYVAAYFAYRSNQPHRKQAVRILMLERDPWTPPRNQPAYVTRVIPHLSVMYLGGFLNPRMLPQQSVNILSNIDDIEKCISHREQEEKRKMLFAFDLPFNDRRQVLSELRTMGITAGSLFPGLDGSCEALKMDLFQDF